MDEYNFPVSLTEKALDEVKNLIKSQEEEEGQQNNLSLRIYISNQNCNGSFDYGLAIDENTEETDIKYKFEDLNIVIDKISAKYLQGAVVDFVEDGNLGGGFKFNNPNEKVGSGCGCGKSFSQAGEEQSGCSSCSGG